MSTFDWTLAGPFLLVAALVAALITPSIARDVREARRAHSRTLPPVTCSHDYRATRDSEGREWHVCGRCGEMVRRSAS